ncbi:Cytochrome P450 2L1 [Chionoecetes opilio]|uniref:Cytochrome P450 2L1 n=1 Tax=Chionoecetes opilio TaxID=41210 RepID=A0A8J4XPM6_CHIOP|nr:Cytochrome P450 2L1 [Chionoecetes opilio]
MGTQTMVFVHDYQLLRDAFNRLEFTDRPSWEIFKFNEEVAYGVVGSNGALWHNNRRFSLRQLRDLGMGKSRLVDAVQRQAAWLAGVLAKQAGRPAPVPHALKIAIVNVLWQLVGGREFDVEDPKLKEFEDLTKAVLDSEASLAIQDFLPWLRYLMPTFLFKRLVKQDVLDVTKKRFCEFFYVSFLHSPAWLTYLQLVLHLISLIFIVLLFTVVEREQTERGEREGREGRERGEKRTKT